MFILFRNGVFSSYYDFIFFPVLTLSSPHCHIQVSTSHLYTEQINALVVSVHFFLDVWDLVFFNVLWFHLGPSPRAPKVSTRSKPMMTSHRTSRQQGRGCSLPCSLSSLGVLDRKGGRRATRKYRIKTDVHSPSYEF